MGKLFFFKRNRTVLCSLKGRCSGVSLFKYLNEYVFDKIKETLPGANKLVYCSRNFLRRETPHYTCQKGSITVEASIVLPLFACFFSFLLFYFRIMEVQLSVQNALEETGRSLAIMAVKELEEPGEEPDYLLLAKGMLVQRMGDDALIRQYVSGGTLGVSLLTSEFDGDEVLLNANYVMRFPVKIFGMQDFLVCQSASFRKWNGWHAWNGKESASALVYVTEYGEVYHMRRSCAYLDLSIQEIAYSELGSKRNQNGETYDACERCGNQSDRTGSVYITNYGECYHYAVTCSGLKRTIFQKQLSEVGGLPACSKCSK